jgi:hypothetical protein
MKNAVKLLCRGLTPPQIAAVAFVFLFTLLGAAALAWALVRWNKRHA